MYKYKEPCCDCQQIGFDKKLAEKDRALDRAYIREEYYLNLIEELGESAKEAEINAHIVADRIVYQNEKSEEV